MYKRQIQHGDVTVYAHVTSVARASLSFAERLGRAGVSVDRASLLRGALLHDYFLYDWHDPDPSHRLHGFRHPFFALARAEEDFELTPRERNIIVRHMFPLVPVPPTCREAWIVCLADKWCALRETVSGRLFDSQLFQFDRIDAIRLCFYTDQLIIQLLFVYCNAADRSVRQCDIPVSYTHLTLPTT